jgi:hypothetical protein
MAPSGAFEEFPMKFSYELKIRNKTASVEMVAPSMDSCASFCGFSGPVSEVEQLKKMIDWNTSVFEIVKSINQNKFFTVVSFTEEGSPEKEEKVESVNSSSEEVLSSEEPSKAEEGDNSYVQGFRYSWSLDNQQDGNAVETSSSSKEDNSEEKVGD